MNEKLVQLYIQGLFEDAFYDNGTMKTRFEGYTEVRQLELALKRGSNGERTENPEFQKALELMQSPLMKALS